MAPTFAFPSLPSLQSVRDLLPDTSPPVLYPETSRSRRSSSSVAATAAAASRQSFSCPSSPRRGHRPLQSQDARLVDQPCFSSYAPTIPLPQMSGHAAHPHIESPLDQTGPVSASSVTFPATATRGILAPHTESVAPVSPLSLSPLPPRASAFDGTGAWRPIGTRTPRSTDPNATASSSPARSGHRRSQSVIATTSPVKPQRSRTLEFRNSIGSASALNLPTLAEDDSFARPVPVPSDRHLPHATSPLASPRSDRLSWLEPTPTRQTRSRAGSTVSVTLADVPPSAPLATSPLLTRRGSITISTPISGRSRRGSMASIASFSMNSSAPVGASPSPAAATLTVSGISAVAEWSEPALPDFAPPSPTPRRNRSIKSMSISSPGEQLRARLRSLSEIDTPGDGTPAAALAALTARPSRPPSTISASPHPPSTPSRRGTPGRESITPTGGGTGSTPTATFPLSPTPTRRHRPSSMLGHNFRHSMPDPLVLIPDAIERPAYRPTTSRLRQPAQLSMGEAAAARDSFLQPRNRRPSTMTLHLEAASPPRRGSATPILELPVSPIITSSPGSLVSDNGSSSPTTSVESLTLGIPSLSLDPTRVGDKWRRDIPDPSTSFRVFGDESIDSERFLDFDDI